MKRKEKKNKKCIKHIHIKRHVHIKTVYTNGNERIKRKETDKKELSYIYFEHVLCLQHSNENWPIFICRMINELHITACNFSKEKK